MHLSCLNFIDGGWLPVKFAADGDNVNPEFVIKDTPQGTQSLVLVMESLGNVNAKKKQTRVHWLMWNIPPEVTKISSGEIPVGAVVGINDLWEHGYGGPYPMAGETHKYRFRIYALNITLNIPSAASYQEIKKTIKDRILDKDQLLVLYQRK